MASYNGRRAPNVSRYLANLNTMPSAQEIAAQQNINLGDDSLDFLTNTEFFDFDQFNSPAAAFEQPAIQNDIKDAQQFPYIDFQAYQQNNLTSPSTMPPSSQNGLQGTYPPQPQNFAANPPMTGDKRTASVALQSGSDMDEVSRMAAEEDKRRRNTAASARFRVKKKQREQALEKQTKEMSNKMQQLESKVQQLEMENKWLKELITEKTDGKNVDSLLEKKGHKEFDGRSTESHTDGVGTKAEDEE